jgi:hypothetical protein
MLQKHVKIDLEPFPLARAFFPSRALQYPAGLLELTSAVQDHHYHFIQHNHSPSSPQHANLKRNWTRLDSVKHITTFLTPPHTKTPAQWIRPRNSSRCRASSSRTEGSSLPGAASVCLPLYPRFETSHIQTSLAPGEMGHISTCAFIRKKTPPFLEQPSTYLLKDPKS